MERLEVQVVQILTIYFILFDWVRDREQALIPSCKELRKILPPCRLPEDSLWVKNLSTLNTHRVSLRWTLISLEMEMAGLKLNRDTWILFEFVSREAVCKDLFGETAANSVRIKKRLPDARPSGTHLLWLRSLFHSFSCPARPPKAVIERWRHQAKRSFHRFLLQR